MHNNTTNNITTAETEINQHKLELIETRMQTMLEESLHRGFFGTINIGAEIQDGTIQLVRSTLDQLDR